MAQVQAYARRLNNPFRGVLQVVATDAVRALSFDGREWELQYLCDMTKMSASFANLHAGQPYARIGRWAAQRGFRPFPLDPRLNHLEVETASRALLAALESVKVPLPLDDVYELWLLDEKDRLPLALLASDRTAREIADSHIRAAWEAIKPAQLELPNTPDEERKGLPPVSHRLEYLVKKRAGQNPQAVWFQRLEAGQGARLDAGGGSIGLLPAKAFPALLLREDWGTDQIARDLCGRYLQRLSPRLLILQNLSLEMRGRVEQMACQHALEVDGYFHLYPGVADEQRMTALRVEARLRRAHGI